MQHALFSAPRVAGGVSLAVKVTAIAVTLALLPSSAMAQYEDPLTRPYGYDDADANDLYDTDDASENETYGDRYDRRGVIEGGYDAIDDNVRWYDPSTWVGRRYPTREEQPGAYFGYGHDRDYSTGYGRDYYEAFDDADTAYQGYRGLDSGYRWYTDRWYDDNDAFYDWYD